MGDSIDRAAVRRNTWRLLLVVIAVSLASIVVASCWSVPVGTRPTTRRP